MIMDVFGYHMLAHIKREQQRQNLHWVNFVESTI